jgi:hypothetical protein
MRDNAVLINASDKYSKPHATRHDLPTGFTSAAGGDINLFSA